MNVNPSAGAPIRLKHLLWLIGAALILFLVGCNTSLETNSNRYSLMYQSEASYAPTSPEAAKMASPIATRTQQEPSAAPGTVR